jgi:hypothetical protein
MLLDFYQNFKTEVHEIFKFYKEISTHVTPHLSMIEMIDAHILKQDEATHSALGVHTSQLISTNY